MGTIINGVKYYNATYFIVGDSGTIATSIDTVTWYLRTSGFGTSSVDDITFVGKDSLYIASDTGSSFAVSTDTITWTQRTSGY